MDAAPASCAARQSWAAVHFLWCASSNTYPALSADLIAFGLPARIARRASSSTAMRSLPSRASGLRQRSRSGRKTMEHTERMSVDEREIRELVERRAAAVNAGDYPA